MKQMDRYLERLLGAAAAAPVPTPAEHSLATEARVLSALRAARAGLGAETAGLLSLFRRGLAVAGACAAIAMFLSMELQPGDPDLFAISEAAFAAELAAR